MYVLSTRFSIQIRKEEQKEGETTIPVWFKFFFHLFGSSMKGKATLQLSKLFFFKVADAKFKVDFHFISLSHF